MEVEHRKHFVNGVNPMSVLALERGISLVRYTNFSEGLRLRKTEKCGFVNLGNTCFMNSILQCLRHTKPLLEFCLGWDLDVKTDGNISTNENLFFTYVKLMRLVSKGPENILPLEFVSHVSKYLERFAGGSQQDAQEFFIFTLERMHADLRFLELNISSTGFMRRKDERCDDINNCGRSRITDIFGGTLRSTLRCSKCKSESHNFEQFFDLSLPTPENQEISLLESISNFTKQEVLTGANKPTCNNCCSRQKFLKCYSFEKFPRILVIHLKRFNDRTQRKTLVSFPLLKLDLTKFSYKSSSTTTVYKLYAVSNHCGNLEGGHYTAFARGHSPGDWYHYNDSRVTKVEEESVVTSDAYLLFYEFMH